MNVETDYVADWRHHDRVKDATYETPPDSTPKRTVGGFKAKLEGLDPTRYQLPPVGVTDKTHACMLWPVGELDIDILLNGTLKLKETGRFVIISKRKSPLGHWLLIVNEELTNGDGTG